MCEPITGAMAIGMISAGMGAMQSIASYQTQSQAAAASEQAYQQQRQAYEAQLTQNQLAANRGYQQTQLKFKGEFDQATQKAEQLLTSRLQSQGSVLAAGRAGQSVGGLLSDAQRVENKDLGTLGMNLAYAQQDYGFGMENIFEQQSSANVSATSQINAAASNRLAAPSVGGLLLGIGEAGLSGASTYMSLKAPQAFGKAKGPTAPKAPPTTKPPAK